MKQKPLVIVGCALLMLFLATLSQAQQKIAHKKAQAKSARAAKRVTVTLVRWPYT
jgi:hypothetical protein